MEISWITDTLALSGGIENYEQLEEEGIDVVINVRAEQHDDVCELTKRGIIYYWIPIADYQPPRSDQVRLYLDLLEKHMGEKVLVHCAVGRGRSAMLVAIHLVKNGNSIDNAVKEIQRIRPQVLLTDVQLHKLKIVEDLNFYETG